MAMEPGGYPVHYWNLKATLEARAMLKWAFVFLLIAIVAGIFGFTGVEATAATIAKWLFGIFLFLFIGALFIGLAIGSKLMS
jgi:uncharacterized membrane protein YtjA (UPF0391 family)